VNETGTGLVMGKIHTIRQNHEFWKRFEGRDVALFYWEGKPYRSKQVVFCVKRLVRVQRIWYRPWDCQFFGTCKFCGCHACDEDSPVPMDIIAKNDGFNGTRDIEEWFWNYPDGEMAILHFTDFRYWGEK
jgi:hypothetical protein